MIPTASYRLATTSGDYRKAHAFCKEKDMEDVPMGFPTVLAEKDDECVGVLSTLPSEKAVIAGRWAAEGRFTLLHLADAYERVLQLAGVKFYLIPVDKDNTALRNALEKALDITPAEIDETHVWYRRVLGNAEWTEN